MSQRGSIRRQGRYWRLVVRAPRDAEGRRRRLSVRLGTFAELPTAAAARRAADHVLEQMAPRSAQSGAVMTWGAWCERYIARELALLARGTRTTRTSIVRKHLMPAASLTGRLLHEIGPSEAQDFILEQHRAGVAATTVYARFAALRRVLRAAREAGIAATPVRADQVKFPKVETVFQTLRAKAFNETSVAAILEAAPEPLGTICAACRYLALRIGEALALTWETVNLDTGAVEIRQQAQDGRVVALKSRSSAAVLRAPGPLLERLRVYRSTWTPNAAGLLFADSDGRPLGADALRRELHQLLDHLGLERKAFHGLRHAACLAMGAEACSPEATRRAMRHSSIRTTAAYLHATDADIANALEASARRGAAMAQPESITPQETPSHSTASVIAEGTNETE